MTAKITVTVSDHHFRKRSWANHSTMVTKVTDPAKPQIKSPLHKQKPLISSKTLPRASHPSCQMLSTAQTTFLTYSALTATAASASAPAKSTSNCAERSPSGQTCPRVRKDRSIRWVRSTPFKLLVSAKPKSSNSIKWKRSTGRWWVRSTKWN